jgi:large subunit ribosomal protein L4
VSDLKAPLFAGDGTRKGEIPLDPEVFGIEPNHAVLHQVVTAQLAGARTGTASTKTRAEVRGGGRKPWRQKGLGRARQGSIRAPQWSGGGVAHGPRPRGFGERTPKKMKRLALCSALASRAREGAVSVVEPPEWTTPQTRAARDLLAAMQVYGKALIVLHQSDGVAQRAFRNLPQVILSEPGHLNAYDVLWADHVVFTTSTVGSIGRASTYDVGAGDFVKESR